MNYVFFGTPEFAAIVLEKLIAGDYVPAAVVCNPDRPVGRKKIITAPPSKLEIRKQNLENRIRILQPEILDSRFQILLSDVKPDFFIVAAYAKIIPKEILAIPRLGTVGVHPSLLPKYRGPSPIQNAILNGDQETGVTLYLMDEKMDHGEIISKIKSQISKSDTYEILMRKLANAAGELLLETLPKFANGEMKPVPQDESQAAYTKKFERKDAFVEPEELRAAEQGTDSTKAAEIDRKIRAFDPEPGAWTYVKALTNRRIRMQEDKTVKLLEAEVRDGKLVLKKIQIEGGKPKSVSN